MQKRLPSRGSLPVLPRRRILLQVRLPPQATPSLLSALPRKRTDPAEPRHWQTNQSMAGSYDALRDTKGGLEHREAERGKARQKRAATIWWALLLSHAVR